MNELKTSGRLVKEMNRSTVLNLIKSGPVSRVEIATVSGLSAAAVSNITTELIDAGLIVESGTVESARGRPPVALELRSDARYVVGVKVMSDALVAVVTDLDANVVASETLHMEATDPGAPIRPERLVESLAQLTRSIVSSAAINEDSLLGVGLGLAGIIDSDRGVCRYSPFFDWTDVDLVTPLSEATGLDVFLENDVNSLTLAEKWFGHGLGYRNFVVVTVGRGVGVGIVVNGQFYNGTVGGVGELGHIPVLPDGPLCTCGNRGCLETLASDDAVVRMVVGRIAEGAESVLSSVEVIEIDDVLSAARDGDEVAIDALRQSGEWLGTGLATLCNLLNPELVIVAGEGVEAGSFRLEPMRKALEDKRFDGRDPGPEIVFEFSGDQAWARGAACVVLGEFFRSPLPGYQSQDRALASR